MRAFVGFVRKETLHLLRDRQTLGILLLFPVVQVLIFGFAVRTDVQDVAIAIVDPTPDVACIPPSGSLFPRGTTLVACTATDASGNHSTKQFPVTVRAKAQRPDITPPVLSVPSTITVLDGFADGPGEVVTYTVTASDDRDPSPVVSCAPPSGSFFPRGTTLVECTATDASGNQSTSQFPVTVRAKARRP